MTTGPDTGVHHGLDVGTYEVLRDRLAAQAAELTRRTEALNTRRGAEFGTPRLELTAAGQLCTESACVPRAVVAVGEGLLLGYNAESGDAPEATAGDVFALYDRSLNRLPEDAAPGLLDDPDFVRELTALYRYYRQTRLLGLRRAGDRLLALFQTGERADDIRVLRWALRADGAASFLDARGERDDVLPPAHDIKWTVTTREDHIPGRHPHVRVQDEVFVDTLEGTLTVKAENDTGTGQGVYAEPVDDPLQSLADADIAHARAGATLILLRVRPYHEDTDRYLVFHTLTRTVVRLDGIGQSCRLLPEGQGIVFPGGYCLADGTHKVFELDSRGLEFECTVRSPHGEDVLFAYRARAQGRSLLLSYNTIRKEMAAPLSCHGWALSGDGTLTVLRTVGDEAARVHPAQIWRSPYVSETHAAATPTGTGALARVGNADLVRGISDCLSVAGTVAGMAPSTQLYEGLVADCVRVADSYHWLGDADLGDLRTPLDGVRDTAEQVTAEFAAVQSLTRQAAEALEEATAGRAALTRRLRGEVPHSAIAWITGLTDLRRTLGHLLTLKEMRYADTARIDEAAAETEADLASFGQRAVAFLAREDAFADHHADIEQLTARAAEIATTAEAAPLLARLDALSESLETVTEIVTGLDTQDATVRTGILERISQTVGALARARATLGARRRALLEQEGRAAFAAEFSLFGQAVSNALATADTPQRCDDRLAQLLVQLENLESRFAEFDDFGTELADKRTEVHEAFSARRQTLADARARRVERLADAADRVLRTVSGRAASLTDTEAVTTYFTSDPLVAKVCRTADELRDLGDRGRAEELTGRLEAARREAARALRDRTDMYADGGRTLLLGRHRFAVNAEPLDVALVPDGEGLAFAVTGTDYRAPMTAPDAAAFHRYRDRPLPSESPGVYRAEHLAACLLDEHGSAALAAADLPDLVRRTAQARYDEGYERGVHDHDATAILTALLRLHEAAGPLRHEPAARATGQLFWAHGTTAETRQTWRRRAVSLARARDTFGPTAEIDELRAQLAEAITAWAGVPDAPADGGAAAAAPRTGTGAAHPVHGATGGGPAGHAAAAAYLFEELTSGPDGFVLSAAARTLLDAFRDAVGTPAYDDDLAALDELPARKQLVAAWLSSYCAFLGRHIAPQDLAEAVAAELCPDLPRHVSDADLTETVDGLLGTHPRIVQGELTLRIDEFLARTEAFRAHDVPDHRAWQHRRTVLVAAERDRLHLDTHRPRVMSAFVRTRLIDEVYLPLIGDSLAKQLGTTGDAGRPGTGGLLLLISPPGYGKTTLMEYVADRLGLLLVKVSGPALGHAATSLDPADAPNATARHEIEKINFALAAGSNTLLYLDDIQHTSAELLQKFIPLCDATRRVEGVLNGEPHTFDLHGKRFAVCMAGNPHTESGSRFHVPDMLANRADIWNLGSVLAGKDSTFARSFVECALSANPVLAPLAERDRADLDLLIRLAEDDPTAHADRLSHPYARAELERTLAVLRHVLTARATVLAVNAAYLASAAQSDTTRTEPPFLLQGSYRNLNKITQRIQPVMNDAELAAVVDDHYTAEAQTLTTAAEANLLKLAELRGTPTDRQEARWTQVKAAYVRSQTGGEPAEDEQLTPARAADPAHPRKTSLVAALGLLADRVAAVESAITRATDPRTLLTVPRARTCPEPEEQK